MITKDTPIIETKEYMEYSYEGFIEKYPISLELKQTSPTSFEGHYSYEKEKKPIRVEGVLHNQILKLETYNKENGDVEYFEGSWSNGGQIIEGRWHAPDIDKKGKFVLNIVK